MLLFFLHELSSPSMEPSWGLGERAGEQNILVVLLQRITLGAAAGSAAVSATATPTTSTTTTATATATPTADTTTGFHHPGASLVSRLYGLPARVQIKYPLHEADNVLVGLSSLRTDSWGDHS